VFPVRYGLGLCISYSRNPFLNCCLQEGASTSAVWLLSPRGDEEGTQHHINNGDWKMTICWLRIAELSFSYPMSANVNQEQQKHVITCTGSAGLKTLSSRPLFLLLFVLSLTNSLLYSSFSPAWRCTVRDTNTKHVGRVTFSLSS
jgi:hypothetical protein